MHIKNYIIYIILIIFSILYSIMAFLNISARAMEGDILNQMNYTIIVSFVLIISSIVGIVIEYLKTKRNMNSPDTLKQSAENHDQSNKANSKRNRKRLYISLFILFLFVISFSYIGYFTMSLLFVFIFTLILFDWKKDKIKNAVVYSVALTVFLYFVFDLINVYLPNALLI